MQNINSQASAQNTTFSAGSRPQQRRALEIMGWIVLSLLIITGLSSVIGRALFLNDAIA